MRAVAYAPARCDTAPLRVAQSGLPMCREGADYPPARLDSKAKKDEAVSISGKRCFGRIAH